MSDSQESAGGVKEAVTDVLNEPIAEEMSANEAPEGANPDPAAAPTKEMEQAINNMKRKLMLKVDGEEIEEEIDLGDEEDLKRRLQKAKAFDKRVSEYSSFKKQVDQLMDALKNDPASILSQLGHNIDDLAEKHLRARIEEAKKSPEQLAQEKMAKELKEAKAEAEKLKKEKENSDLERMKNEHATIIENDIKMSLDKASTMLPKNNPWVIQEIARTMILAMKNGYPNVTPKDVIPFVEDQFKNNVKSLADVLPEDVVESLIGKNNLDRIRKKRIKEQKNTQTANQIAKSTNNQPNPRDKEKQKISYKKYFGLHD